MDEQFYLTYIREAAIIGREQMEENIEVWKKRLNPDCFLNGCGINMEGEPLFRKPRMSAYQFKTGQFACVDHQWKAWEGRKGAVRQWA